MAIRKSADLENESDDKYTKSKSAEKVANIAERFDDTTDNDNPFDDAIQYINKKIDECVDEINLSDSSKVITSAQASAITANTAKVGTTSTERSRIAANHSKVGITTSQASQITANNAKIGTETNLCITEEITLRATVEEKRGTYTLKFTMAHGETTKTAEIALK